jgi:hypothetical protein
LYTGLLDLFKLKRYKKCPRLNFTWVGNEMCKENRKKTLSVSGWGICRLAYMDWYFDLIERAENRCSISKAIAKRWSRHKWGQSVQEDYESFIPVVNTEIVYKKPKWKLWFFLYHILGKEMRCSRKGCF